MPRGMDNLPPPPTSGTMRGSPSMAGGEPGVGDLMSRIAGRGQGGGNDQQAAQLVMSGVQQLVQAAQMNPALGDAVQQSISIIQNAVQSLAQQSGAMGPGGKGPRKRAPKKSQGNGAEMGQGDEMGGGMGTGAY